MPPRSLSSQSYRGLPMYNARKEVVADKIRSLGRIFHRSDSSSNSTTVSEVPTPLGAKERRRQARDPYELHSESVASSPLFNSPSSESARSPGDVCRGSIFDPLVRAGTLMATAELDRLSFLANARGIDSSPSDKEPTPVSTGTSSTGNVPANTPGTCLGSSSTMTHLVPQTDGVLTPAVPTNTPTSGLAMPVLSNASHLVKHGHHRNGARSRLSEYYISEDASKDVQEQSGSESGSVITTSRAQSSADGAGTAKDGDKRKRDEVYHGLVPKPLSSTPSPSKEAKERMGPDRTAPLNGPSSKHKPDEKLDMVQLNDLLDKAIGNSIVTQRLNATKTSPPHFVGTCLFDTNTLRSSTASQLKLLDSESREAPPSLTLGSVGIRPFIKSRASSPGPRRERSTRGLSSLSAASPIVKRHMARHVSRSTNPAESRAVPCKPDGWSPDRGDEPGDSDLFCPELLGHSSGHEQQIDLEAITSQTKVRRSTSGTVHVTEMAESCEGSSSGTESSESDAPLADDACPSELAKLKQLREQLHCIMPGTLPRDEEDQDAVE